MEYLKISNIIDSGKSYSFYGVEKLTDDQILDKVIGDIQVEDDNGIYTCIGEDKDRQFKKFKNIETSIICNIKDDDLDTFEEENIVMYPDESDDKDEFYKNMRREYYEKIIHNFTDRYAKEHAIRKSYLYRRK